VIFLTKPSFVEITFTYCTYVVAVYPHLSNWERAAAGKVEFQDSILKYHVLPALGEGYPDADENEVFTGLTWKHFTCSAGPVYAKRPRLSLAPVRTVTTAAAASSRQIVTVTIASPPADEPWSPSKFGTKHGNPNCHCDRPGSCNPHEFGVPMPH
jgi:hypothetical protein